MDASLLATIIRTLREEGWIVLPPKNESGEVAASPTETAPSPTPTKEEET